MRRRTQGSAAVAALGLMLVLPAMGIAQSATDEDAAVQVPQVEGLAWHQVVGLTDEQWSETLSVDELAEWDVLSEAAGVSIDEIEYTYQAAFDPTRLPDLGGIATVRIEGATSDTIHAALIEDLRAQAVGTGSADPDVSAATIGGKDVSIVSLPAQMSGRDAIVYSHGDSGWVILLEPASAEQALAQLP